MRSLAVRASIALVAALCATVVASAGCSSSDATPAALDCAYVTSADNCWKKSVAALATCVPPAASVGTFSADKKTCTFANGALVTFDPAFDPAASSWSFTITNGGVQCLHYANQGSAGMSLTTSLGTISEVISGGATVTVTCPDGTVRAGNGLSLLSCPIDGGAASGLPGIQTTSSTPSTVSFLGGPTGTQLVFSCQ